jgi:signal transduction histidine kinase
VRRRSATNLGESNGGTGSVNEGQANGEGSGLLADGSAGDSGANGKWDVGATAPQAAVGPTAAAPGVPGSAVTSREGYGGPGTQAAPAAAPPGTGTAPARPRQSATSRSRFALTNWRVRWRLVAVIAVPTLTAAILGSLLLYGDTSNWNASGRVQHLAQLNSAVVKLSQSLENERDLSAGYAAAYPTDRTAGRGSALAGELAKAQATTTADVSTVTTLANGVTVGSGYQPGTVQDLNTLTDSLQDLKIIRNEIAISPTPVPKIIQVYTENIIDPANTFSGSVGAGANDASLEGNVITLGALLRTENDMSQQRAILFAALSSPTVTLLPDELAALQQAVQLQTADLADFTGSTDTAEQQNYQNTVSGPSVDLAQYQEELAESMAGTNSSRPLTANNSGLTAGGWYTNMSATIDDTRQVADELTSAVTARANTLRSRATQSLLITSVATLLLLLLVLLVSTIVARSLIRPLRKLRSDALDVAGHRLPEMVRRLSQSEGADEGVEIEPIGVTSTDEIGEVARAFDQVHREAVRLAADEAMLRGNLNAMFINLSRRSQSLIERQLSLIDSLEQSEQDSGRLSSLFRLDHLATRMRRNSENLLVLAGHEVTRRWSQPVALVDVLRAAISEIEQYERVVLNVQPGIVVVGQAVNDVVHLVAEIVENATTFSPEDTQVYVSGQPLSSGGVLLDITDNGVGISDQEMSHANWRLDNPPVVDVAVSRRMGLFVVGRLAARHGVRVRLRHAQAGGLTALIWLPDTVAAPEVAPPLGRLRRFEADDYGPAASLSAPTATATLASQATAAARIPRFSPGAPASAPAGSATQPAAPSFNPTTHTPTTGTPPGGTPASGTPVGGGTPATGTPATGIPVGGPGRPAVPAQGSQAQSGPQPVQGAPDAPAAPAAAGLGDGGLAAVRNGWDLGGQWGDDDDDEPPTQALPVRNGNVAPANGNLSDDGAGLPAPTSPAAPVSSAPPAGPAAPAGPESPVAPAGPSRLPAFTGLSSRGPQAPQFPIGSQNVHGSDGPSASDTNGVANGARGLGGAGNGSGADDAAADSGRVAVPPPGPHEQRLPIFDSLESDWFRRSGEPLTPAGARTQGPLEAQAQSAGQASWTSPADEGWRAAEAVAVPAAGETTQAGLPRRVPRANLVPGSVGNGGTPGSQETETEAPARSPDAARSRMSSFQRGVREGRAAAPPQTEEP